MVGQTQRRGGYTEGILFDPGSGRPVGKYLGVPATRPGPAPGSSAPAKLPAEPRYWLWTFAVVSGTDRTQ